MLSNPSFLELSIKGKYEEILSLCDNSIEKDVYYWKILALEKLGRYDAAIEFYETLELEEELNGRVLRRIAICYNIKGDFELSLKLGLQSLDVAKKFANLGDIASSYNSLGVITNRMGDYAKSLHYLNLSLEIQEKNGDRLEIASLLNNIGVTNLELGFLDNAIENYEKSLNIYKELDNQHYIAMSLNNIGVIYDEKGEYEKALQFYERSLEYKEKIGNKFEIAMSLNNIGEVYRVNGMYDRAMDYYLQSLKLREEIGNEIEIADSLINIGKVNEKIRNYELAKENYLASLKIKIQMNHKRKIAGNLLDLVNIYLKLEDRDSAKEYMKQLVKLAEEDKNPVIIQYDRLSRGMYYKSYNRAKGLVMAFDLFMEVINSEMVRFELTKEALLQACEILIAEFSVYKDESVLDEINDLISKLLKQSMEKNIYSLTMDALILKSRTFLIQGKFSESMSILDDAYKLIISQNLSGFIPKIEEEKERIIDLMNEWNALLIDSEELKKSIQDNELMNYMKVLSEFQT